MRPRRRTDPSGEAGFTLIEMLVGMTLMLIVFAATLTAFDVFSKSTARGERVTSAEDKARSRLDFMVFALRNAAAASTSNIVLRAGANDLVVNTDQPGFGQANGTAGTARYCLDSAANGKLWFGWTATPNVVPAAPCPTSGWTNVEVISSGVANQSQSQPLFQYASATPSAVRAARVDLYMTSTGTKTTHLQSGVFLRSLTQTAPGTDCSTCTASCGAGDVVTLTLGVGSDANGNPLKVTVSEGALQLASGTGTRTLTLPSGVHNLVVNVTDVLGVTQSFTRSVTCP